MSRGPMGTGAHRKACRSRERLLCEPALRRLRFRIRDAADRRRISGAARLAA